MADLRVPDLQVSVDGSRAPVLRVVVDSGPEGVWARIASPAAAQVEAGAAARITLGGAVAAAGEVTDAHRGDRVLRWRIEPAASRSLRGAPDGDEVGPFGWRRASASAMAAAVLDGFQHDLQALPDVRLRWSAPRAPRRWALRSLLDAVALAAGRPLTAVVRADGSLALGPAAQLRRASGVSIERPIRGPQPCGLGGAVELEAAAVPVGRGDLLHVDGSRMVCVRARHVAAAGRYRSRLVAEAA